MSRQDRVSSAIKKEVSLIIHDKLKDPRIGFVTVTGVEISKDLRNARVFYSVLGNQEDYKKTQEALDSALGLVRSLVSDRLGLRFAPEIIFRKDRSSEYSVRIEEVLDQIKALESGSPASASQHKGMPGVPLLREGQAPKRAKRKGGKNEPKKSGRRVKRT